MEKSGELKGVEKSGEFAVLYDSDSQLWKQDLNEEHYGVHKYGVGSDKKTLGMGQINFTRDVYV